MHELLEKLGLGGLEELIADVPDDALSLLARRLVAQEELRYLNSRKGEFVVFSFRDVHTADGSKYVLKYQDPVAKEICDALKTAPGHVQLDQFLDGSTILTLHENVRRRDIYLVFNPDSEKDLDGEIYRLMKFVKTLKQSHGGNITTVVPCLPYSRQDQSYGKRQLVDARFLADMLDTAGMNHMITIGLHSPQIEGFYRSIDHLKTRVVFSHYLQNGARKKFESSIELEGEYENGITFYRSHVRLISPDAGGMRGINELRRDLDPERKIEVGFVQKERIGVNQAESGKVVGDVAGKVVVLYDDILDTGGSLFGAAKALKGAGAVYVMACIDHALGNTKPGEASFEQKLADSDIDQLVVTNTKPEFVERVRSDYRLAAKTTVLSIAPLLKEAIIRDQQGYTIRDMVQHVGAGNLYRIVLSPD